MVSLGFRRLRLCFTIGSIHRGIIGLCGIYYFGIGANQVPSNRKNGK